MSIQNSIDRLNSIKERIRTNLVAQGITVPEDSALAEMAEQILSVAGEDGITPHIGDNGNWFVGEMDTGVRAEGKPGVHVGSNTPPVGTRVWVNPNGKRMDALPNPFSLILRGLAESDVLYDGSEEVIVDFGGMPEIEVPGASEAPEAPEDDGSDTSTRLYMRAYDGYIQYSEDGVLWEDVIAVDDLRGEDYVLTDVDRLLIASIVIDQLPKYSGEVEGA